MPRLIEHPAVIKGEGTKQKVIHEHVGRVASGDAALSVARMNSPQGWHEPGQRPQFDEVTLVLGGRLRVEHEEGALDVGPGQALITRKGEWVRYATPYPGGAEYVAICLPAFSPQTVNRDA